MIYLGIFGQWLAVFLCVIGLTLVIHEHAPWPYVILTAAAIVFAAFTKIRLLGYEADERIRKEREKDHD